MSEAVARAAFFRVWPAIIVAATLAGCGGGGGPAGGGGGLAGGGGGVSPDSQPNRPEEIAPHDPIVTGPFERDANWGVGLINAPAAYDVGAGGQGVTVAIIDTGVEPDHPELENNFDQRSIDLFGRDLDDLASPHGTGVAGVVAAAADGTGTVGVAPKAAILSVRAEDEEGFLSDADAARGVDYAVDNDADIINISFESGEIRDPSPELAAALRRAANRGVLVTVAAGNSGEDNPRSPAITAADPAYRGLVLAIGGVDRNAEILSFSNRAGATQERYLVAAGIGVRTTTTGGGFRTGSGTSYAAPHAAGAAAALKTAFPSLSMREIANLLVATARDLGESGVDPIYGAGLIDLAAALRPSGAMAMASGTRVAAGETPIATSTIEAGAALGDALNASKALADGMALDAFDKPFPFDYRSRIAPAAIGLDTAIIAGVEDVDHVDLASDLARSVGADRASFAIKERADHEAALTSALDRGALGLAARGLDPKADDAAARARFGWSMGANRADVALGQGLEATPGGGSAVFRARRHLALVDHHVAASLSRAIGEAARARMSVGGDGEAWRAALGLEGATPLGAITLAAAAAQEDDAVLGARGVGGFAFDETARSSALLLAWRGAAFGLAFDADLEWAWSDGAAGEALSLDAIGALAYGLGVTRRGVFREGDHVRLSLGQPLRVERGSATIDAPVARTEDGRVLRRRETIDAQPSGREIDLELRYAAPLAGGALALAAGVAIEPGHVADADPEFLWGGRYRLRF